MENVHQHFHPLRGDVFAVPQHLPALFPAEVALIIVEVFDVLANGATLLPPSLLWPGDVVLPLSTLEQV